MVKQTLTALVLVAALPLMGSRCAEGNGSGGSAPTRRIEAVKDCAPIDGPFPPGFSWLPGSDGHAVAVQPAGPAVGFYDMNGKRPRLIEKDELRSVPPDSDGDGEPDEDQRLCDDDENDEFVSMGKPLGVSDTLAFVAGSGYEEVMFFEAPNGRLAEFSVTNPPNTMNGSYHGEDYPYLPDSTGDRTAISTKACIYLTEETGIPDATSIGRAVGQHACCDRVEDSPSFMTTFTAGMAIASEQLFVATSNLDLPNSFLGSYFPGTVLVYDVDVDGSAIQPNSDTPVIFTTGFNPTGVSHYRTTMGRDLILVTNTGALGVGVGRSNILTDSFIDIIDAQSRTLVATIPMGAAGLSFDGVAIDPAKRVGLIGSWTLPVLYAIDLRALEDEDLYEQNEIIWLDGSDPVFPDARIFDADSAFEIPDRNGGPHPIVCDGWTFAAINQAGEAAYVLERCDGTLTQVNLLDAPTTCEAAGSTFACCERTPLPASCFSLGPIQNVTKPFTAVTGLHGPTQISVRPGEPGIDYSGPDLFFTVDLPEGQLCATRVDSL